MLELISSQINNPKHYFFCKNGEVLKSFQDFKSEIIKNTHNLNLENFHFHTNNNNNDYSNWLEHVFGASYLADKIRKLKDPSEFIQAIKEFETKQLNKNIPKDNVIENDVSTQKEKDFFGEINKSKKGFESHLESSEALLDKTKALKKRSKSIKSGNLETISAIKERCAQFDEQISGFRKEGYDMLIPHLKMINIKSKIKYLPYSINKNDYHNINLLLDDIENDIKEALTEKKLDLKTQILKEAGLWDEIVKPSE